MSTTGNEFVVRDTGKDRRVSTTGCERDNRAGKGRYDLLPAFALKRDALLYEKGAEKYTARNWERGQSFSWCLDSALRHIHQYAQGDRVEDHLAAARFHLASLMHYEEMIRRGLLPADLDDLPTYTPRGGGSIPCCERCGHLFIPTYGSSCCQTCNKIVETLASPDKETPDEPPTTRS